MRPAQARDKAAITSFCRHTFSWGDYIAEVFDDWLEDRNGRLFVGLVDDRPVAIVHTALLDDRVAWMEGMRVHPDYRRHGIASAIDTAGRDFARERGCKVARLATSIKNIAAQNVLEPLGYRLLTRTDGWEAPSLDAGDPLPPIATIEDVPRILTMWDQSPLRLASAQVLPDPHWRWTELTPERVRMQVAENAIRIIPSGFSMVRILGDPDGSGEDHVDAIVGDSDSIRTLALGARAEAGSRGFARFEAMVAHDDHLAAILSNAGYIREGAMLIYEIDL